MDDEAPSPPPPPDAADKFGFAWDIAMGMHKVRLYRGRGQPLTLDDKLELARRILEHLRIAGVRLSRLPPPR